jgi:Capsular polysaccharide biosynthesis protein
MWPFKKHFTTKNTQLFLDRTDWHSHILPKVDDGAQTLEESLTMLLCMQKSGIKNVWATPHIMEDVPNTTAFLKERFEELKAAYKGPITLNLGAEYMLDNLFKERFKNNDLLPLVRDGRKCLLIETSYVAPPENFLETIDEIRDKGYHPVLAHPERYLYMGNKEYKKLVRRGVSFQINVPSLAGYYGSFIRKKAVILLYDGYYDFWGTDAHQPYGLEKIFKK